MSKSSVLSFCLIIFWSCSEKATDPQRKSFRPNILYILADDLGYGDLSVYNPDSKIKTANLDRLANEGMRLTDAHSPSSVCTPTRYGILTGRYCWRSRLPRGVLRGYGRALIEKDRTTVASLLQRQNYTTGVIGKWHLGLDWVIKEGKSLTSSEDNSSINELGMVRDMDPNWIDFNKKPTDGPLDHGFDYSFILPASLDMEPYCYLENDELTELPSEYTPGNDLNTGYTDAFWRAGKISPGFEFEQVLPTFRNKAIAFIDRVAKSNDPFFLYLPLAAPHTPWVPVAEYSDRTKAGLYGDFVSMVDSEVGKILAALERNGLSKNTLVIFTSDNGPFWTPSLIEKYRHQSAGSLRGMKADAWEGGHRIPYIARWPDHIPAGSQSGALTSLTHLMATVAELLGVPMKENEGEDSRSILPVLLGQQDQVQDQTAVIHHSSRDFFAIRKGQWKLIEGRGSGGFSQPQIYQPKEGEAPGQLYHLSKDLAEQNNLYLDRPEKVRELSELLTQIQAGVVR